MVNSSVSHVPLRLAVVGIPFMEDNDQAQPMSFSSRLHLTSLRYLVFNYDLSNNNATHQCLTTK